MADPQPTHEGQPPHQGPSQPDRGPGAAGSPAERARAAVRLSEAPAAAALLVVAVGLAAVGFGKWRAGSQCVGLGLLLAAGLRLSLPARRAGLLVVRSRALDAALLLALGFALVGLATVVPHSD